MNQINENIAVAAVLFLLGRTLALPSWPVSLALVVAFLVFAYERHQQALNERDAKKVTDVQALIQKVDELARLQTDVALQAAETKNQHEEMKKILSSSALVSSFKPPIRRSQSAHVGS